MARLNNLVQVADDPAAAFYVVQNLTSGGRNLSICARMVLSNARDNACRRLTHPQFGGKGKLAEEKLIEFIAGRRRGEIPALLKVQLANLQQVQTQGLVGQPQTNQSLLKQQLDSAIDDLKFRRSILKDLSNLDEIGLNQKLRDPRPLVRWLAIESIAMRRMHCEQALIDRLKDPVPAIREAAHQALVRLARGTDLGPANAHAASAEVRDEAGTRWRQWLRGQQMDTE